MKARERVLAALSHEEPDRIPIDLGGTGVTSLTTPAYRSLRRALGLPEHEPEVVDLVQQLPRVDEDVLEALQVDVRSIGPNPPSRYRREVFVENGYYAFYDEFGAKLRMPREGGHYFDWVEFPFSEPTIAAVESFPWPDPDDPARYEGLRDRARALREGTEYAIAGAAPLGSDLLARLQRTRGFGEAMVDLVLNREFVEAFLDKATDIALRAWGHFLDQVGEYLDVAATFEDLGTQTGPMISPALYRSLIKPRQARIVALIKSKSRAKVFLHSCGAVYDFIPDLIEIGIDILNPIQLAAKGMGDTASLKWMFGRNLVFWGGACDAQGTLPSGTQEQVRAEVRRRIADLAPGGGYVFAGAHNIQGDVPASNLLALFSAAKEYGRYPLAPLA